MSWPRWLGGRGRGSAVPTVSTGTESLVGEVLLRRLERLSFAPKRAVAGGLGGEHRSSARASSTDFADYRQYLPGDDFRRIDWNAYGRSGNLYVKLTEAREQLPVHILLDASRSMAWGEPAKLRYATQLAAALGYVALARFDRLSISALGERVRQLPATRGRGKLPHLLAFLESVEPSGAMQLDRALGEYRVNRRAGGVAVVISDLLSPEGYQRGFDALLQAGLDVVVLQVLSPQELEPMAGGDVELEDAETGEIVQVSLTPRMLAVYRERLDRWCADAEQACAERGIVYARISTAEPLEDVILDRMRRMGILR
jgi:uncharacterized protein (DUF58 family)